MKVNRSNFLSEKRELLKDLNAKLSKNFDYVSILGTDSTGKVYSIQRSGIEISDSMWVERGFVVRVYNGRNYYEFSFNEISREILNDIVEKIKKDINSDKKGLKENSFKMSNYPLIDEKEIKESYIGDVKILPEEVSAEDKVKRLKKIHENGLSIEKKLIDFRVMYEEVQINKIYISSKKNLEQAYVWTQGMLIPIAREENNTKYNFEDFSGLKGVEIIDKMEENYKEIAHEAVELLEAESVEPGEYEIICSPKIAGLIAHEAFGHGVEMDMFVKNRAKAVKYLDKQVASELVTMHDGAAAAKEVSSYLFDDEGVKGTDTVVIDNGILKRGISDRLSAFKLGTSPTGNGKRESYERKAYARMTHTFFSPGEDELDDMISSIEHGYLLDKYMSGMEDPKNWGIQCMILNGYEIKDGELTGKVVSPIVLTGYVPDVLKSISMVSRKVELSGVGMCGKGHKELVKTANGGPYIKTKARLG